MVPLLDCIHFRHIVNIYFQLKSAYAIAKLRKTGYSKQKFYEEALELYKEVRFCPVVFAVQS